MDGSSLGEQQVQNEALLRPGLEPETSQPQRRALPLDHAELGSILVNPFEDIVAGFDPLPRSSQTGAVGGVGVVGVGGVDCGSGLL